MQKQTTVDQIEITRDGTLQVRFAKQIIDDDGGILSNEWHRTAFPPGQDIAGQMAAVNDHLTSMNCKPVDVAELSRLNDVAAVIWTDETKATYRQAVEAAVQSDLAESAAVKATA